MALISGKCPNCGGTLQVDNSKDAAICPYCKTPYIVEKAVKNYNIYNANNYSNYHTENNYITYNGSSNIEALLSRAHDCLYSDYERCIDCCEQVLGISANNAEAYYLLYKANMHYNGDGSDYFKQYVAYKYRDKAINCLSSALRYAKDSSLKKEIERNIIFDLPEFTQDQLTRIECWSSDSFKKKITQEIAKMEERRKKAEAESIILKKTEIEATKKQKTKKRFVWFLMILFAALAAIEKGSQSKNLQEPQSIGHFESAQDIKRPGASALFQIGKPLYLEQNADGSYHAVTDVVRANKILYWDNGADSWVDETTHCWLWYKTDVEPALWQYWIEGISSDYGEYGWMEHDENGWFIEKGEENWIPLPDRYDISHLWYIE